MCLFGIQAKKFGIKERIEEIVNDEEKMGDFMHEFRNIKRRVLHKPSLSYSKDIAM